MENYNFEDIYSRRTGHESLGMTNKYFKNNYWYKQNLRGYEGMSEAICSMILKHSNITDYVSYEQCIINGVMGCRSRNFINDTESVVTFQRLYSITYGGSLKSKIASYSSMEDRVNYVIDFIYEYTGLNCQDYLAVNMYFDMLTLNVDRHFGNLALIHKSDNTWRTSPLFDFGASFFSLQHVFKPDMSLEEKYSIMTPQPFDGNFERQAEHFGKPDIKFDYNNIYRELEAIEGITPELSGLVVSQLEGYKNIFPDLDKKHKVNKSLLNRLSR